MELNAEILEATREAAAEERESADSAGGSVGAEVEALLSAARRERQELKAELEALLHRVQVRQFNFIHSKAWRRRLRLSAEGKEREEREEKSARGLWVEFFCCMQKNPNLSVLAAEALEVDSALMEMRQRQFQTQVDEIQESHSRTALGFEAFLTRLLKTLEMRSETPPQALRLNRETEGVPNFFITKPSEEDSRLARRVAFMR